MLIVHIPIERSVAGAIVLSSLSFVVEFIDKAKRPSSTFSSHCVYDPSTGIQPATSYRVMGHKFPKL